jgi:hypothetical protein
LAENQNRRRSRVTSNESNSSNSLTTSVVESSVELVSDASSAIANNEAINTYDFGSSSLDVVNISLTEGLAIYAEGAPVREILERNEARAQRAGRPRTAGRIRATGQRRVADFRARNPRPTLSVTRVLKSSVAGNAGPLAVVGGVISTAGMLDRFWHDANAVDRGDISGWRYGYRSVGNVAGGVIGVVIPFGDSGTYGLFDGYEEVFFDTPRLDQP